MLKLCFYLNPASSSALQAPEAGFSAALVWVVGLVILSALGMGIYSLVRSARQHAPEARPRRQTPALASLLITHSSGSMQRFPLSTQAFTIGRSRQNSLCLAYPDISRHHAIIRYAQDSWLIQDMGSRRGILVNGERVTSARLKSGDCITIEETTLVFQESGTTTIPLDTSA